MKHKIVFIAMMSVVLVWGQKNEGIPFSLTGEVAPRNSNEIASSNWSIGGETMDRDFTDFDQWKSYLGPTGAKKVRLQAGWAKCEPKKGEYNFKWLDDIIDNVISQGVEPWLQVSYGNPVYEGGGYPDLSGGFPVSEEALHAWDNWVRELAERYKDRVKIWEIWNESDLNKSNIPEDYAKLFIRTTEIIRSSISGAKIYAMSLAGPNTAYVKPFLDYLKGNDKLHLVDVITLHGYTKRPEDVYGAYSEVQRLVANYSDHIIIGQGELGCPSEEQAHYALKNYPWTETSQSKWLLRKLLSDLGRDIPSLYFTMIDMNYVRRLEKVNGQVVELKEPIYTVNTKGLLKANPDNTVAYKKPSYSAYQNITSIFDNNLERIPNYSYTSTSKVPLSVFGYRSKNFDRQTVVVWKDGGIPSDSTDKTSMTFEFNSGSFEIPVYVDLRTGKVYDIPKSNYKNNGSKYTFKNIPIYDSPILIADKSLIKISEDNKR